MSGGSVSVVIPTLDEAHHLGELLPQLGEQTLRPREVIVADAGSSDGTSDVAREHGATVVAGGRPAFGRNTGALHAGGDWIVFIDADTRLPRRDLLERALQVGASRQATALVADYRPHYRPGDRGFGRPAVRLWDRVMLGLLSIGQRGSLRSGFPIGQGLFLLTRRVAFEELGGFDEGAEPFEDSAYLLRLHRARGRPALAVLPRELWVAVSTRRYDALGRIGFPLSMVLRGGLLRFLLRRELPDPDYWAVNARGLYREER